MRVLLAMNGDYGALREGLARAISSVLLAQLRPTVSCSKLSIVMTACICRHAVKLRGHDSNDKTDELVYHCPLVFTVRRSIGKGVPSTSRNF
jgi:hypothetical protein